MIEYTASLRRQFESTQPDMSWAALPPAAEPSAAGDEGGSDDDDDGRAAATRAALDESDTEPHAGAERWTWTWTRTPMRSGGRR